MTPYRGPLLIHAGQSRADLKSGGALVPTCPNDSELPFGAIVGIVELVHIRPASECRSDPFVKGPLCWIVENPRAIEPVPYRGVLGIFKVPDALVASSIAWPGRALGSSRIRDGATAGNRSATCRGDADGNTGSVPEGIPKLPEGRYRSGWFSLKSTSLCAVPERVFSSHRHVPRLRLRSNMKLVKATNSRTV
jgi:hypothetical protein